MLDVLKKIENYLSLLLRCKTSSNVGCLSDSAQCLLTISLCLAVSCLSVVSAQSSPIDTDVDALLAEIQSHQETRVVYNAIGGFKVADVSVAYPFKVIERRGDWRLVQFNRHLVAGWVSSDYVSIDGGTATVDASNLNVRIEPTATGRIITTVPRNYQAKVQAQRAGFVRLLLPSDRYFAIKKESVPSTSLATQQNVLGSSPPESATVANSQVSKTQRNEVKQTDTAADRAKIISPSAKEQPQTAKSSNSAVPNNAQDGARLHKISPGDAVSLLVFGEQDLSIQNVRVPQSGRVSFPLIGSVLVAGKTTDEVEQSVADLLSQGYVRNPRLSVTIFSYRPVFIRGAVRETGSYPFTEGLTIAKAIALAGGSKNSAKIGGVSVSRDGQLVEQGLNIDSEVEVSSGDVISITEEVGVSEDAASYIYLHGEVPSPGEYLYRRGLTVEKAIVLAGGFTIRASRKKISVTRYTEQDDNGKPKRLKRVKLYEPIEPGDVIVVGASLF